MATEVKLRSDAPQTMEARIARRLRPSCCGDGADSYAITGTGPTRAASETFNSFNRTWGSVNKGEGSIDGKPRGVV
jgi:hypothetical protein